MTLPVAAVVSCALAILANVTLREADGGSA
jgi:hypothetical protein